MTELSEGRKRRKRRKKLGEILVEAGLIDAVTLEKALYLSKSKNKKLGEILAEMGAVDDLGIAKALSSQLKIPFRRIAEDPIPESVLSLIPEKLSRKYSLIPIRKKDEKLFVAIADPLDINALNDLRFVTQRPISIFISLRSEILAAIDRSYARDRTYKLNGLTDALDVKMEVVQRKGRNTEEEEQDAADLLTVAKLKPVVRLTNAILADAIMKEASDIHIEPQKTNLLIRCRVDGVMHELITTDKHVHRALVSRIKVISNLDIFIRRKPYRSISSAQLSLNFTR